MPKPLTIPEKTDPSTESRIREAAQKLFIQKGYAATSIRDIARDAGTNVALISYYFRGKENLFKSIMLEHVRAFFQSIMVVVNDDKTTLREKIQSLCDAYTRTLSAQPDLPMFVLNELRLHPQELLEHTGLKPVLKGSVLFRQFTEAAKHTPFADIDPAHLFLNMFSMLVFPFFSRPIIQSITGAPDKAYNKLLQDRRTLIPLWMDAILGKGAEV